jgi:(p)ppGpp synthase/HD superfamily hydrolase
MLTERFESALVFAFRTHQHQRRKVTGSPYFSHLMAVSSLVLEHGGNEDEAIAALLHDSIEDCQVSPAAIEEGFGPRVLHIVQLCTEPSGLKWRPRKERYIAQIATSHDDGVLRVSLADKVHNAQSMLKDWHVVGDDLWRVFGRDNTLWYMQALLDIYPADWPLTQHYADTLEALRATR